MLYLAEVQKQKAGFIGVTKAELKLLACQRADQSWNSVPGEELISAEVSNLSAGALVLADLNTNRQVQRIQEAGRPLVNILQTFSRQLEKSKSLEEEIATWKDSLNYQSQELNNRRLEMEARLENLQTLEDDFKTLEAQQQKIDDQRRQIEGLQKDVERNRQDLQGAWENLRGEQRRLEEQKSQLQQTTLLDEGTAHQIQELLASLSRDATLMRENLNFSFEIATQQNVLDQHWQRLEEQLLTAQQQQEEVDNNCLTLQNSLQNWQQAQTSLEQLLTKLQVQVTVLNSKQEHSQMLGLQLRQHHDLYQNINSLIATDNELDVNQQVNTEALEGMPLDQLQQLVQEMQRHLHKASQFVDDQEEELQFKQQAIDELQAQLSQASENDRMNLEAQMADEQDCYLMLNETLVGQRQNLRERQQILSQHQIVLQRRQEVHTDRGQEGKKANLRPILMQLEAQQQQKIEERQRLEQQILQLGDSIKQMQETIDHQAPEQEMKRQELQNLEQNLVSLRSAAALCWGRVNLYQEMLQPIQDNLNSLRQKLEATAGATNQLQATTAQLQEKLLGLLAANS